MYECSKCGATMSTPQGRCPGCGVLLSGIRCKSCGFSGSKNDFQLNNHRCPKCNSVVQYQGRKTSGKENTCPKCHIKMPSGDMTCKKCGHTQTGGVLFILILSFVLLTSFSWNLKSLFWTVVIMLAGMLFLLSAILWIKDAIKYGGKK
jgi:hypothetical protein